MVKDTWVDYEGPQGSKGDCTRPLKTKREFGEAYRTIGGNMAYGSLNILGFEEFKVSMNELGSCE